MKQKRSFKAILFLSVLCFPTTPAHITVSQQAKALGASARCVPACELQQAVTSPRACPQLHRVREMATKKHCVYTWSFVSDRKSSEANSRDQTEQRAPQIMLVTQVTSSQAYPRHLHIMLVPAARPSPPLPTRQQVLLFSQEGVKGSALSVLEGIAQHTAMFKLFHIFAFCTMEVLTALEASRSLFLKGRVSHEHNPCLREKHCHYLLLRMLFRISLLCTLIMTH